jgi:hypothetical protein
LTKNYFSEISFVRKIGRKEIQYSWVSMNFCPNEFLAKYNVWENEIFPNEEYPCMWKSDIFLIDLFGFAIF